MNVLMLTCQYLPDVYGGAEKQCRRLSSVLQRMGANVQIITSAQNRKSLQFTDDQLSVTRIYTKVAPDLLGRWSAFSVYWTLRVLVWGLRNRTKYDIIHCHQGKFGAFVGCLLGRVTGKPVVIKIGNSEEDMDLLCLRRKFFFGPLCFNFIRSTQPKMIAISSVIEKNLRDAGFTNIEKIANGIDRSVAAVPLARLENGCVNFFYHGRVESIKRIDLLVRSFALLRGRPVKLHIFGDGRDLEGAKMLAKELGIEQDVHFYGAVDDVLSRIAAMDIFVNASRAEGFSNSLLEALLLEKVMVSTDVSGASDAIEEGVNGFIAKESTPQGLASAMERALELFAHGREQAGQECRRKVCENFDMDLIAQKYLQVYGGLR